MTLLGIVLAVLGLVLGSTLLLVIGVVLIAVGLLGNGFAYSRPVGSRRYWY